jgi:hypothetical protein
MMDRDWHYTYFTEKGARIAGVRREHMLGKLVREVFPRAVAERFAAEGGLDARRR